VRAMRLLNWLDELDRRFIPQRWRVASPANEQTLRRMLRIPGAVLVGLCIVYLVSQKWVVAAVDGVIGITALVSSGPFSRWAIERQARGHP
jgi:uncharacterized protein YjeT (DUF2065 family)